MLLLGGTGGEILEINQRRVSRVYFAGISVIRLETATKKLYFPFHKEL